VGLAPVIIMQPGTVRSENQSCVRGKSTITARRLMARMRLRARSGAHRRRAACEIITNGVTMSCNIIMSHGIHPKINIVNKHTAPQFNSLARILATRHHTGGVYVYVFVCARALFCKTRAADLMCPHGPCFKIHFRC
jgi:hypothetical protein